ncbi:MAG: dual specificity protein phosphatase family protein [Planctomycetales bacterium]|nr:dual specificity protein phosphatase family protein [Planctomycetales bacterium]
MEPTPDAALWLGGTGDLLHFERLFEHSIGAIVDLAFEELRPSIPRDIIYCRFPLNDGGGNPYGILRLAVETVAALASVPVTTLVCCSAGMSRSPTIAAYAIATRTGESPESVLLRIGEHASLESNQALWNDVTQACQALLRSGT